MGVSKLGSFYTGGQEALIGVSSNGTIYTIWSVLQGYNTYWLANFCNGNWLGNYTYDTHTLWCKAYNPTDNSIHFFAETINHYASHFKNGSYVGSYDKAIYSAAYDNSGNLYAICTDGSVTKNNTTILPANTVSSNAKIAIYNSDYYIYDAGKVYKNGTLYARFNNCKNNAVDFVVE